MIPKIVGFVVTAVLVLAAGCTRNPAGSQAVIDESASEVLSRLEKDGQVANATLGAGMVRYLGFEVFPDGALPGDEVTIVHYWQAHRVVPKRYRVFVHALLEGARGWIAHGDHDPTPPTTRWPVGTVIRDEHTLVLPAHLPGEEVLLRVGLYAGAERLPVDEAGAHDGDHRLFAGAFSVSGKGTPRPRYSAPKLSTPPKLDGHVGDEEWGHAPWIESFTPSAGRGRAQVTTRARLAWDADHLYVAFVADDPDILAGYQNRDQPIYREEAVEIFIDADGDRRSYVELQVSPLGTQFDAKFSGGPRRNMTVAYNATYTVGLRVDGSVERPGGKPVGGADQRWVTEWAIDVRSIPGAVHPLKGGARWRVNLFRIAKDRHAGVLNADESAWSAPLMGDFHNLERFGDLWFVDESVP